jgi:tetratricopeptide (TPR) repeat protein
MDPVVRQQIGEEVDRVHALERSQDLPAASLGAAYGKLGQVFHAYELHESAREAYRAAQALAPGEFAWPYYLGQVDRLLGDTEAAVRDLERALALRKDDASALLALSQVRMQRGETAEADRLARRALLLDPDSAAAQVVLAEVATARRDHAAAAASYERALRLQPNATKLHQPLAVAYRALGKQDLAERHLAQRGDGKVAVADRLLERVVALRRGLEADLEVGQAALQRGDFPTAADAFRRAVAAAPDDARAHANLAAALGQIGDRDGALRELREALRLKPDDAQSHFNLGVVLGSSGDDDGAIREYEEAVRGNDAYSAARFNLANALRRRGRCRDALPHYRWVVEHEPRQLHPRVGEVSCLAREGKRAEALRRVDEGLRALPAEPGLQAMEARLLSTSAEAPGRDAGRALRMATALAAERTAESLETLAMALAGSARYAEAVTAQRAAIAEARTGGRTDLLARLEENLKLYQQKRPCRDPGL